MSNKRLGNAFEVRVAEILSAAGFWVHRLTQNDAGQPADIIAVKDSRAALIDCKVCSGKRFPLTRVEENQELAMVHWRRCGNGTGWFAIDLDGIWMVSHIDISSMRERHISLHADDIKVIGIPIERWVETW